MNKLKYLLALFLLVILLSSCDKNLTTEGNYIFPDKFAKIKVGLSKQDIFYLLGPKSLRSSFDENTWYYMYETSEKTLRFMDKNILDAKVITLTFKGDTLVKISTLNKNDRRNIALDESSTQKNIKKTKIGDARFKDIDSLNYKEDN